jgi:hypothetical protein
MDVFYGISPFRVGRFGLSSTGVLSIIPAVGEDFREVLTRRAQAFKMLTAKSDSLEVLRKEHPW